MSAARCFPCRRYSDTDTWTVSAGLLAERKQTGRQCGCSRERERKNSRGFHVDAKIPSEEMNASNNSNYNTNKKKLNTSSDDCTHCTIVELPRGAALSLRQTQETLRLLDSCGANGNMCGLKHRPRAANGKIPNAELAAEFGPHF